VQVFSARDAATIGAIAPDVAARVRINPFPIDLPAPADVRQEVPGTVLFIGNFMHSPNVDAVTWLVGDIMPLLRRAYPGVRLTVAGSDPRGIARCLAASDVLVTGYVSDLQRLIDQAAIVIAPIRIGGGQRMKVLHSMAAAKATVTTARGAAGLELGHDKPGLMIADDAAGIARAAAELLRSPAARHQLARRARAVVEAHYTAHAYAARSEAIYRELVAPAGDLRRTGSDGL
jgi:glycosyltransferase involved in cell wall biosynthesis